MSPQSYPLTSQFTSDDFNLLANDINEIVGTAGRRFWLWANSVIR